MRYGVITTGRMWYFCRVDDNGLQVSQPISWDSQAPPLLAAVSFIMTRALQDRDKSKLVSTSGQRGFMRCTVHLKLSAKRIVGLWLNEQTAAHPLWTTVLHGGASPCQPA